MSTFSHLDRFLGSTPADLVLLLARADLGRGREEAFRRQHPERLEALTEIARVQSIEASNAIEGITAPSARIRAIAAEKTAPANRSEQEIAGYRGVLDLIHSTPPESIRLTAGVIRQLHGQMGALTGMPAGDFKTSDNLVEEQLPDGTRRTRFIPVPAWRTEEAVRELNERYLTAIEQGRYHPLLLIGSYVLDFLVIHPFNDGNGRMSRLLTLLLLYRSGYEVGRYVSLERRIAISKETYYESLQASTAGWQESEHDPLPWLRCFAGVVIVGAYNEFEARVGALGGKGSKSEALSAFLSSSIKDEFSIADLRRASPTASDALIRKRLREWQQDGIIENATSHGRNATYRRLRRDA